MMVYRAAWVCPIAEPPIPNGWFAIENGRIAAVGAPGAPAPTASVHDLGRVAALPGLVNAHTHLELSWLQGRVPPAAEFVDWVKQLIIARGSRGSAPDEAIDSATTRAAREARTLGTVAVGDISNSLSPVPLVRAARLRGIVFHELLGFGHVNGHLVEATREARVKAADAGGDAVRVSLAPHAPYSTSPELFRAIRAEVVSSDVPVSSVHVAESSGEVDFLRDGSGPWPGMLRFVGAMRDEWTPPQCRPIAYLESLGVLDPRTLVIHAVHLDDQELQRLAAIGCTLVTCPRSNQWVGAGAPPIARFYASGVRVAVGTDSLASVDDLNLFSELKALRWLAPGVAARRLLDSATLSGAKALDLDDDLGSIEVGKRAEIVTVDVPAVVDDVEEYLVSGIHPRQIRWVPS